MRNGKSLSFIVCGLILLICVPAWAQMRIARPVDGATVRETVSILVPVSSVPSNPSPGFISVSVDGAYKAASAERSDDGRYVVYRWDTKAIEVSPETGEEKGRPKDGKHIIRVQGYTSEGKKIGDFAQIAVYVKNNASADMPAGGLKLRYKSPVGSIEQYRFKYTVDLKSIEGATSMAAAVGDAMEGSEGTVRRSVEDVIDVDSVLVRQKLIGELQLYLAGQPMPAAVYTKSEYHVEDSLGHTTYIMYSSSPGVAIGVDLPILPSQPVRIGDTWSEPMKLFKAALTGESARLNAVSTLEGLEWEGGHPCAKIRTRFSGDVRIPSSQLLKKSLFLSGEAMTYFAYRVGKVVSFRVKASAQPELDQSEVQGLTQMLLSAKSAPGTGGSEDLTIRLRSVGSGASGSGTGQRVKIKLEFRQSLDLVQ